MFRFQQLYPDSVLLEQQQQTSSRECTESVLTGNDLMGNFLMSFDEGAISECLIWTFTTLKFKYSEKTTKFCEFTTSLLTKVNTYRQK